MRYRQTISAQIEFYAVRRSNNFQEHWEPCRVLDSSNTSFVLVRFIPKANRPNEITEYLVPRYEIRGPGFLPAELFYNLIH